MADVKRVDPETGTAYTLDEICEAYRGQFKKKDIVAYWKTTCKAAPRRRAKLSVEKATAERAPSEVASEVCGEGGCDAEEEKEVAEQAPPPGRPPPLRRTRSWLVKVAGLTLLPCEEALAPLLEEHSARRDAEDMDGMEAAQLKLLQEHPFVASQVKEVPSQALGEGVTCTAHNFRMDVPKFKRWLRTPEGKPFEEKGKGFDDGCYLTSAVLRAFMPRGYTVFNFADKAGNSASVVMRGFLKFTGLTATDEDEESGATQATDAFMFNGYARADASRFAVTEKSNGENGKYTARKVFGDWYCFAGSKNTGMAWRIGCDVPVVYPIPQDSGNNGASQVGPKIVRHIHEMLSGMPSDTRTACLEAIDADRLTVMFEFNDPMHEHIFPIPTVLADHVSLLGRKGFPLPQREAFALFDKYGLKHVPCTVYDDMGKLDEVMEGVRASTDTEGVVIYLERADDTPVGLVKVKSDHYVIARRTREILRSTLVQPIVKGTPVSEALQKAQKQLRQGMKLLTHLSGCNEHHEEWAEFAVAFARHWADAYRVGDAEAQKKLVAEYSEKYGSLYHRFWTSWKNGEVSPASPTDTQDAAVEEDEQAGEGKSTRRDRGRRRKQKE